MNFRVYHSKDWDLNSKLHFVKEEDAFRKNLDDSFSVFNKDGYVTEFSRYDYEIVAEVECEDKNQVFQLTNTIDDYWWNNDEVTALKTKTRSTSVGDIVEDVENNKFWMVLGLGWKKFLSDL